MSWLSNLRERFSRAGPAQAYYDGAQTRGKRVIGWVASSSGPRSTVNSTLHTLRNRSREQVRNNGVIRHGITSLVSNEVGTGIIPRSRTPNKDLRDTINDLWSRSEGELDADGLLDVYGMQSLASRTRRTAGEVFLRRRYRRTADGLSVPMQVQLLEPDFVPLDKNETLPNGNEICAGIEFDRRGRRVAYHMYPSHPGDGGELLGGRLLRIPAADVIHHFMPLRPGQVRGEPDVVATLLSARDLAEYQEAELVRKKTRAPFTGFMKRAPIEYGSDAQLDPITGLPLDVEDELPQIGVQPGTILTGIPGEELMMFDGDDAGNGYADYMRQQLLYQAVAMDLPYEVLSGDWKDVNDRLVRVILNEFHRYIESVQDHYMIHQVCGGVWRWWIDAAVLARRLPANNLRDDAYGLRLCEWRPQGWKYIHPVQDVEAKLKSISGGLSSRQAEVAKSGWDVEEIDRQNREDQRRAEGLPYGYTETETTEIETDEDMV